MLQDMTQLHIVRLSILYTLSLLYVLKFLPLLLNDAFQIQDDVMYDNILKPYIVVYDFYNVVWSSTCLIKLW